MNKEVCWLDGRITPVQEARIPVLDHGLLYGDGVFEGIRFYHEKPFLLERHLDRLSDSARAISLEYPWSLEMLGSIAQQVIEASGLSDGYLYLLVTRGEGALGIDPLFCKDPRLIVIADHLQMVGSKVRERGADLIIASTKRLSADGLDPRIKSLNYLNHILARIEANHAGADEAILLNGQGNVAEGTADNLFVVKNAVIMTPPVTDGVLAGITRQLVLDLADDAGFHVREQTLASYDLYTADECFLSGTGGELIPVRCIDGRSVAICPGPIIQLLREAIQTFIERTCGQVSDISQIPWNETMKKDKAERHANPVPVPADSIPPPMMKTIYPAPFAHQVEGRIKRKLGDYFGLTNFGVNMTELEPGAVSALLHHHSKQDEFIYVLEGQPILVLGEEEYLLGPGDCYGFRAGSGIASQLVNRSEKPVTYLEIGDRTEGDEVVYPKDDLKAAQLSDGKWLLTHKDGRPY